MPLFLLQLRVYWPGIDPPSGQRPATDRLSHGTAVLHALYSRFERKTLVMDNAVLPRVYQASVYTNSFRRTDSARLGGGFKARRRTKVLIPNTDDVSSFM